VNSSAPENVRFEVSTNTSLPVSLFGVFFAVTQVVQMCALAEQICGNAGDHLRGAAVVVAQIR
jgi:hypothetical protein